MTPVRVEPGGQSYERIPVLPDPYPLKFRAGPKFKAVDSATFSVDGTLYELSGAPHIDRGQICVVERRKYACGLNALKALDNAMRGHLVECNILKTEREKRFVSCRVNGRALPDLRSNMSQMCGDTSINSADRSGLCSTF